MKREVGTPPLTHWKSALKGFLGGSLLSLGVFVPWGFGIQALIFLVGLFVMLETILPFGAYPYIVTAVVSAMAGIVVSYLFFLFGQALPWAVLILLLAALAYLYKSAHMYKVRRLRRLRLRRKKMD
ncbi:MAG: hypothetical protein ACE5FW_02080 [Candidatus Aenigmatarchaeota archaeon]